MMNGFVGPEDETPDGPPGPIPQGALLFAGGTRAGLPHLQTRVPGPRDHPADGDTPGASPAERGPQNLLPEERAGHHPQVHPEGGVHSGEALRRRCPAGWDAVGSHIWELSTLGHRRKKEAQGFVTEVPSSAEGGSEMLSLSCRWGTGAQGLGDLPQTARSFEF